QSNRARQMRKGVNDEHWQTIRNNRSMIEQDQFIGRFLRLHLGLFARRTVPDAIHWSRCCRLLFKYVYPSFGRQNTQISAPRQFLPCPEQEPLEEAGSWELGVGSARSTFHFPR